MKLVFATNNAHKLEEARAILQSYMEVCSLDEVGFVSDIEETGETLEDNSLLKARTVADWLDQHEVEGVSGVFADDTGLEIEALGGRPGVYTARWAGEACRPLDNCHKALRELEGEANRNARFRTVVTLIRGEKTEQVSGEVRGHIAEQMSGNGGFGYDPLFIPEGHDRTFAELPAEVKNSISHRARAMAALRKLLSVLLLLFVLLPVSAMTWKTHFMYNSVTQIAASQDKVYGLTDGALFSVDKLTEHIDQYDQQSGLHGSNVLYIYYDETSDKLLIFYADGKIDVLTASRVQYLSDLYNKDITASKAVNNVTEHNGVAYLSMPFGILCFHMGRQEFGNTLYVGHAASEVNVEDVIIRGDSIYALTHTRIRTGEQSSVWRDSMYVAALADNLPDYRVWHSEPRGRVSSDANKGKVITDANGDIWRAGGSEGIVCQRATGEKNTYKPDGPVSNIPYSLTCSGGRLYMLQGGRWATTYNRAGHVMIYDGESHWSIIYASDIKAKAKALSPDSVVVTDMMNVAVDPADPTHFYATTYSSGMYEFRGDTCYDHFTHGGGVITSVVPDFKWRYTWTNSAVFDREGNLRLTNVQVTNSPLIFRLPNGEWVQCRLRVAGLDRSFITPGMICLDRRNEHLTWIPDERHTPGLYIHNYGATIEDTSDDTTIFYNKWVDQNNQEYQPTNVHVVRQAPNNAMWIGTNIGLLIMEDSTANTCRRVDIIDEGENILLEDEIRAIAEDGAGNMWVGTDGRGVYVLNGTGTELVAHYTVNNAPLPANAILSLAYDSVRQVMYIGTSSGLLSCQEGSQTGLSASDTYIYEQTYPGNGMGTWTLHPSVGGMKEVVDGHTNIYALAGGSLFSVDKEEATLTQYDKLSGLNSSSISHIAYDNTTRQLVIVYSDGKIDLLSDDGTVYAITDLYLKSANTSVVVNAIKAGNGRAIMAMEWGVLVLNLKKREVANSYYIGPEASMLNIEDVAILDGDSVLAISGNTMYSARLNALALDYRNWQHIAVPVSGSAQLAVADNRLYLLSNGQLYTYRDSWQLLVGDSITWMHASGNHLLVYHQARQLGVLQADSVRYPSYPAVDAVLADGSYWCGTDEGLMQYAGGESQLHAANGPYTNQIVNLQMFGTKLFATQGYAWATMAARPGHVMTYKNGLWEVIKAADSGYAPRDIMNVAVDPQDESHFYATTYGTGVWEYRNNRVYTHYNANTEGCTLESALADNPWYYTWTAGAMLDKDMNLWVPSGSGGTYALHVLTPQGQWYATPLRNSGSNLTLRIPGQMFTDIRHSNWKWLYEKRQAPQLILLDDNGTPTYSGDDRVMVRSSWIDQFKKPVSPSNIWCVVQDLDGTIWMGTNMGVVTIAHENFFTSNACTRPIIYRNDGTNLVDFLLSGEQVNAIAVDGGNRKWIGTATSGLYLMSADGSETYAHFTTDNSPIPSNNVFSIAINGVSGEVFVATDAGVASYRADATDAQDDMSSVYAYPNPVRPDYKGLITITGLMADSWVTIIDAAGRTVYKTRSYGGTATWNGCVSSGGRAKSGVYTALCNAASGGHTVVKILILN